MHFTLYLAVATFIGLPTSLLGVNFPVPASPSVSFPAGPLPLHDRWQKSVLVIEADIVSVTEHDDSYVQSSQLSIRQIFLDQQPSEKQVDESDYVNVESVPGGGCPADASFNRHKRAIVFLQRDESGKKWTTAFVHPIEVDDDSVAAYKRAFAVLPSILATEELSSRDEKLMQWYVDVAADPETRWEGCWGISCTQRRVTLNDVQREQLVSTMKFESPPAPNSSFIVSLLKDYKSDSMNQILLESLRNGHKEGWRDLTRTAIKILPERLGVKLTRESQRLHEDFWALEDEIGDLIDQLDVLEHGALDPDDQSRFNVAEKDKPALIDQIKSDKAELRERQNIAWGALAMMAFYELKSVVDSK